MARPLAVLVSLLIMVGVLSSICAFLDAFATTTANINGRYIRFARHFIQFVQQIFPQCLTSDCHGVIHAWGEDEFDFALALGYAHARDRGMQLYFTRVVAEGRLSELFMPTPESIALDKLVRRNAFARHVAQEEALLSVDAKRYLQSYADGVNAYAATHARPWPFWLVGYKPTEWTVRDSLVLAKLMGWLGLASVHSEVEKFILDLIRLGDQGQSFAQAIFSPFVSPLDESLITAIRALNISRPFFPPQLRDLLPHAVASNNWAVGATKTVHGKAILASDPHLPVDRLPAFWSEFVMHLPADFRMGVTLPGLPSLWMGRTKHLAFGFTYGFADLVDYFIEGEKYLRDGKWLDLEKDEVEIKMKGMESAKFTQYFTVHGILETEGGSLAGSARQLRLAILYAPLYRTQAQAGSATALSSMDSLVRLPQARTVADAQQVLQRCNVELSANFLLADSQGSIGYQQTGWVPVRPAGHQGLLPLPGWNSAFDWQGIHPAHRLRSDDDAAGLGFMATANNDMQSQVKGAPMALNVHMGSDRVSRITELLNAKPKHSLSDMKTMQADLVSVQARKYLDVMRPLLDRSDPYEQLLATWDLAYTAESKAAALFEEFYEELAIELLGRLVGRARATHYIAQPPFLMMFSWFDRLVLTHDPALAWNNQTVEQLLFQVLRQTKQTQAFATLPTHGEVRTIHMRHIFFGSKLPVSSLLGWEHETALLGSRGSIVQGQLRAGVHPPGMGTGGVSYRLITDFAEPNHMYTALPGGPSDDPLSFFYKNDVKRWENFAYKRLDALFMEPKP